MASLPRRFNGAIQPRAIKVSTNNSTALNDAFTEANGAGLMVYLDSVISASADIPLLHDVQTFGPGGINLGGRIWRATPNTRQNTFSNRQTIYVNPETGNNANSGISPSLAVQTIGQAELILAKYGTLNGIWSITLAAGEYTTGTQFFGITNQGSYPLYIEGPNPGTWDNTSPPANADATGTGVPTAIFRPVLASRGDGAGWALDFQHNLNVVLLNLKFRDYGTKTTNNGNEGAIRAQYRSNLITQNMHIWDCSTGINARDFSNATIGGGIIHGCGRAHYFVAGCRYTLGYLQTASGQTGAQLIRQNTFGLDAWEGSTGHPDYAIFEDNVIHINLRKGGHGACRGPTFRNTGSFGASIGVECRDGGNFNLDGTEVWTGTHTPRVLQENCGVDVNETFFIERLLAFNYSDQTTSTTAVLTASSLVIPANIFTQPPMAIRFKARMTLNNTNSTVALSIRNAGTFVTGLTVPISAASYTAFVEYEVRALTATAQRVTMSLYRSNTNGTANLIAVNSVDTTIAFTSAVTLQLTANCANGSDNVIFRTAEAYRIG